MIKTIKSYKVTIRYLDTNETKIITISAWSDDEASGKVLDILKEEDIYRDIEIFVVEK